MDDPIQCEAVKHVCLDYVQFYSRTVLPQGCIDRATKVDGYLAHEMDGLVFLLRTAVLGEDGGDVALLYASPCHRIDLRVRAPGAHHAVQV